MSPSLTTLFGLLGFLTAVSRQGDNDSCTNDYFQSIGTNATGSISVPGFRTPGLGFPTDQPTNLTVSTAITEVPHFEASNTSIVAQTFWLNGDPPLNISAATLPFVGRLIVLRGFSKPLISTGTNDNGPSSCKGVFSDDCYQGILDTITEYGSEVAAEYSQQSQELCSLILKTPPKQCKNNAWKAVEALQPFGNPDFNLRGGDSATARACHNNVFNGSATHSGILDQFLEPTIGLDNHTMYDDWVERATPVVLFAINRNETIPRFYEPRLACLTAKDVEKGSRIPPAHSGTGAQATLGQDVPVLMLLWWAAAIVFFLP